VRNAADFCGYRTGRAVGYGPKGEEGKKRGPEFKKNRGVISKEESKSGVGVLPWKRVQ